MPNLTLTLTLTLTKQVCAAEMAVRYAALSVIVIR